ncbi:hypothetical protein IMY05_C4778000400 [Salix suchowensis]|nr:hypothetical protein IMY05_C4778000400 [Salix suchowensis]
MASKPSSKRTVCDAKVSSKRTQVLPSPVAAAYLPPQKHTFSVIPEVAPESVAQPISAVSQSEKPTRPATTSRPDISRGTVSTTSRVNQSGNLLLSPVAAVLAIRGDGSCRHCCCKCFSVKECCTQCAGAAATTTAKPTLKAPPPASVNTAKAVPLRAAPPERLVSSARGQAALEASDPLQIAAQLYPWMYMTSTLEANMKYAEASIQVRGLYPLHASHGQSSIRRLLGCIRGQRKELAEQEAEISDQRIRFELERVLALYEELGSRDSFTTHGLKCEELAAKATQLATSASGTGIEHLIISPHGCIQRSLGELGKRGQLTTRNNAPFLALQAYFPKP